MNQHRTRHLRRALTLTELLVVILIIGALLAVAVPSFSSILYSSEAAMAESQFYASIRAARAAALRSSSREDVALVFFYDPAPGGGRLVMSPCVKVADFYDLPTNLPLSTLREIFVPIGSVEPVQLPKNWMVRGYATSNSIEPNGIWYEGNRYGQSPNRGDWVFPETGFFTPGAPSEGRFRQTFIVRFIAGTGVIATQTGATALVFAPAQDEPQNFATVAGADVQELRILRLGNPRRYIERIIASTTISSNFKRTLLTVDCPDMVSVRPVSALALYDESRMASGLRARIDPDTGCLYKRHITNQAPTFVPVAEANGNMTDDDPRTGAIMNQWIEGDTNLVNGIRRRRDGDEPEARLFTIDRYSGALMRVETQR